MIKVTIYDFDKYRRYLTYCLEKFGYEIEICEDAVQECYIEFHKYVKNNTDEFLSEKAFRSWLYTICKHKAFKLKHRVSSIERIRGVEYCFSDIFAESEKGIDEEDDASTLFYQIPSLDTPESRLFAKDLLSYINNHKNKNQSNILKLYIQGYNTIEVAEIVKFSDKTVREWLTRIRKDIRKDFEENRKAVVINRIVQKREKLTGSKNRFAKINEEQVLELRRLRQQGATTIELVDKFGLTKCTVLKIIRKDLWKHI